MHNDKTNHSAEANEALCNRAISAAVRAHCNDGTPLEVGAASHAPTSRAPKISLAGGKRHGRSRSERRARESEGRSASRPTRFSRSPTRYSTT